MKKITICINKLSNSDNVVISIRGVDDNDYRKIELSKNDFTDALFGLAEVPAIERIRVKP